MQLILFIFDTIHGENQNKKPWSNDFKQSDPGNRVQPFIELYVSVAISIFVQANFNGKIGNGYNGKHV